MLILPNINLTLLHLASRVAIELVPQVAHTCRCGASTPSPLVSPVTETGSCHQTGCVCPHVTEYLWEKIMGYVNNGTASLV